MHVHDGWNDEQEIRLPFSFSPFFSENSINKRENEISERKPGITQMKFVYRGREKNLEEKESRTSEGEMRDGRKYKKQWRLKMKNA